MNKQRGDGERERWKILPFQIALLKYYINVQLLTCMQSECHSASNLVVF